MGFYELSSKLQSSPSGGGMYNLKEDYDLQAKFASVVRKIKALESKKNDHIKSVKDISCYLCDHSTQDCPTLPTLRESLHEQLNVIDNFKRSNLNPYSQTYNSSWWNHPNFSWRNDNHAQPSQLALLRQNFQNP